eukprot:TRINITY_DN3778_c0_g1_i2.p1 TRINITY_DN3778_c0_g1~~TRINITY_DN3778_c0_g1_i2.p1  ORF type:complete len:524 (+),score=130.40 TRINITY_DN3778_c0_g1_i2:110-1681(+)
MNDALAELAAAGCCAECCAASPTHASRTYGVLLCSKCATAHLGFTTISVVKALNAEWSAREVLYLKLGGNTQFAEYMEQHGVPKEPWAAKYNHLAAKDYRAHLESLVETEMPRPKEQLSFGFTSHPAHVKPSAAPSASSATPQADAAAPAALSGTPFNVPTSAWTARYNPGSAKVLQHQADVLASQHVGEAASQPANGTQADSAPPSLLDGIAGSVITGLSTLNDNAKQSFAVIADSAKTIAESTSKAVADSTKRIGDTVKTVNTATLLETQQAIGSKLLEVEQAMGSKLKETSQQVLPARLYEAPQVLKQGSEALLHKIQDNTQVLTAMIPPAVPSAVQQKAEQGATVVRHYLTKRADDLISWLDVQHDEPDGQNPAGAKKQATAASCPPVTTPTDASPLLTLVTESPVLPESTKTEAEVPKPAKAGATADAEEKAEVAIVAPPQTPPCAQPEQSPVVEHITSPAAVLESVAEADTVVAADSVAQVEAEPATAVEQKQEIVAEAVAVLEPEAKQAELQQASQ